MQSVSQMMAFQGRAFDAEAVETRMPQASEVEAIIALFESEVRAGKMLPRSAEEIGKRLQDWLVLTQPSQIVGCVSLVFFNDELCEVRSLAVDPAYRGRGYGHILVRAAIDIAHQRGMGRVLTLTRATKLFEEVGFQREVVTNFPEKVWKDCAPCPLRDRCDEVALIYHLDGEVS